VGHWREEPRSGSLAKAGVIEKEWQKNSVDERDGLKTLRQSRRYGGRLRI
jgi:hypothetical protein